MTSSRKCAAPAVGALVVLGAFAIHAQQPKRAVPPGPEWVSLFNGKDLTGWKIPVGDGGHWKVVNGVIDYDASSEAKIFASA